MAFTRQRHRARFTITGQQAADLGHHQVPIPQQVEAHHRNQHQVRQPADQRQPRGRGMAQHHTDNISGLTHMLADGGLELVELPETVRQAELRLRPGQRRVLQPVEHLRGQLIQTKQLPGEQGHQHQQQRGEDQCKQGKHRHDTPGSGQACLLQPIHQRVEQVGQQQRHQERRQDRMQQPDKHTQQDHPAEPEPTPRIGHEPLHCFYIKKEKLPAKT
ncbi:hypothetical protein D3C75_437920 [compost metagenome]